MGCDIFIGINTCESKGKEMGLGRERSYNANMTKIWSKYTCQSCAVFDQNKQACIFPLGSVPCAVCPGEGMSSELPSPCSQVDPKRADHTLHLGRKSFLHGHPWFPSSYLSHMQNPFIGFLANALVCGPLIMVCLLHTTVSSPSSGGSMCFCSRPALSV